MNGLFRRNHGRRRFLGFVFLALPLMVCAQERIIVYDGITGIHNTIIQDDTIIVSTLVPKSPAHRAGIRFRDQIIRINDSPVSGMGLNSREVEDLMYGRSGEIIELKIKRKGVDSLLAFSFPRDPYLYQITAYTCDYLVDSLEQWEIREVMSDSMDARFTDVLTAKIRVWSVEPGSPAAQAGILPGDRVVSLAEEMDMDYFYHISHGILGSITKDTSFTILRGDTTLLFHQVPSLDGALKGIRSQFDYDFSFSCIWLRIRTENRLSENRTYLVNFPEMEGADSVNFFDTTMTGGVIEKRAGNLIPVQERDFIYKDWHAVQVPLLRDREQTFYMRWKAEGEVWGPLMHIIAHDTIVRHDRTERLVLAGFFGMMLIISIFFLILFFAIRGRQYLYFSLYIFSLGVFLFVTEGYLGEMSWEGTFLSGFLSNFRPFLISLVSIFFLLLGIAYLELKRSLKWWYRSVIVVLGLIGIRMATILMESLIHAQIQDAIDEIIIVVWAISVGILPMLILILPAIFRIRSGYRPAWFFLVANIVLIPLAYITIYTSEFSMTVLTLYESVLGRILHVSGVYIAAVLQILIFSVGLAQKMRMDEKEKKRSQERIIEQLKENEKLKDKVNRELEQKVRERTREISEQKEEIESQRDEIEAQRDLVFAQKKEMTDSIHYAQRIQAAVLPHKEFMDQVIPEYFVLFKPRDIVSGDFYWIKEVDRYLIVVEADCTGHGVPGAFMSMLGIALLNEQLGKRRIDRPAEILGQLRKKIKEMLVQQGNIHEQKDGMDMAILIIDKENRELQFAGANSPLYLIRKREPGKDRETAVEAAAETDHRSLIEIKGDKQPIGVYWEEADFTNHLVQLQERDTLYIFSDGFVDQYGGKYRKKFKTPRFKELLLSVQEESMEKQKQLMDQAFEKWRGNNEQIDDVCVIGLRI